MEKAYQVMTVRIMKLLEDGTVPWHRPWGGAEGHPKNLVSDKKYRGINVFMLSSAGYESPYWLSFRQAKACGGNVRKGEKGYPCIFWNWFEKKVDGVDETQKIPFVKYYTVFNTEQCDGVSAPIVEAPKNPFTPIEECEMVVSGMQNPPAISHEGGRAFYRPSTDSIGIPRQERFDSPEDYYCTLFHELTHSTGHTSRLARSGVTGAHHFGSQTYSKEELVGEMGAAFLCGHTGIENKVIDNSAAYISSWLSRLKSDNRLVVHAAAQAHKAFDYILNKKEVSKPLN